MDLEKIRAKLDEAEFTELNTYITDLTGQRDAARKESIDGRHKLKARVKELETSASDMLERLGVDSLEDLAEVDIKGQAEAVKQYSVKLKRLEKELAESQGAVTAITGKYRDSQLSGQIESALGAHQWVDKDLIAMRLKAGISWEEDEPHFEADGKAIGIKEAADYLAQKMPHMIKAGTGGSGYRGDGAMPNGKTNPYSKDGFNYTAQRALEDKNPALAKQLQAQATT